MLDMVRRCSDAKGAECVPVSLCSVCCVDTSSDREVIEGGELRERRGVKEPGVRVMTE